MPLNIQPRYRLCELFGIPVYLDLSLIVLLFFFTTGGGTFWSGIACATMLLASITMHELGHALTARAFGYTTRDITLSLLGGCASLIAMPRKASQEFAVAVAGPAVSFALSFLGAAALSLCASRATLGGALGLAASSLANAFGFEADWGRLYGELLIPAHLAYALLYFSVMNAMLWLFNLLPGFPMDGGRIFRCAMRPFTDRVRATYIAMVVGRATAVFIGLRGVWNILHGGNFGFVTVLIAWMIWKEGYREYVASAMEAGSWRARVSPPPYGGDSDERDVRGWRG